MGREVFKVEIDKLMAQQKGLIEPVLGTPANSYLELAINTTKLRKRAFAAFNASMLKHEKKFEFSDSAPFAIASKEDPTQVIMYPNLPRTVDPVVIAHHTVQMWSDGRRRRKIEDPERASKYAMKREVTSMGKFLTNHSNLKSLGWKDDQIRSFGEVLSVENLPPQIVVCSCPEDYIEMFKVATGSCMQVGSYYWDTWSGESLPKIAEDTGIFMGAWYHYAPWCNGAYVVVAGVPVARFILYKDDITDENWKYYGDVHGSSINYGNVIKEWIAKQGIIPYGKKATAIAKFRIPGITHPLLEKEHGRDQLFCPLPNMDNQDINFEVNFDKSTGEFVFYPPNKGKGKTKRITYTYTWRGFIPSNQVPNV